MHFICLLALVHWHSYKVGRSPLLFWDQWRDLRINLWEIVRGRYDVGEWQELVV